MQVFKAYFKILQKSIKGLSIYVIIFIALSFFLSGSGKESNVGQFTKTKINIAVINEDEGIMGSEFKSYLGGIHKLVELANDKETLQDALYYRNVEYILFIPKDFTEKIKAGEIKDLCEAVKVPASYTGKYLDSQVEQYISTLTSYAVAGVKEKEAVAYTASDLSKESTIRLLNNQIQISNTDDYYYFKYLPYILISVVVMGIGPILMVFQTKEINERNLCSSLALKWKNLQLILGSMVTVFSLLALFLAIAFVAYSKDLTLQKSIYYTLNTIAFLMIATGIAYFVSLLVSKNTVLNMVTNVLALGMSFIGGIFVPREALGDSVIAVSKFLPTYWYINGVEAIQELASNHARIKELEISIGIQVLFAVAIFAAALATTRLKIDGKKQMS